MTFMGQEKRASSCGASVTGELHGDPHSTGDDVAADVHGKAMSEMRRGM